MPLNVMRIVKHSARVMILPCTSSGMGTVCIYYQKPKRCGIIYQLSTIGNIKARSKYTSMGATILLQKYDCTNKLLKRVRVASNNKR